MSRTWVGDAVWAGLAYYAVVFAGGFALGVVRVLVLVPSLPMSGGEAIAVLIELPIMLALSWVVCRWLIAAFKVEKALAARLLMGACVFTSLIGSEVLLGTLGFGRSVAEQLHRYGNAPELLGLMGQCAFGALPLLQLLWQPHFARGKRS